MAKYRFITTDITTGTILFDNLPVTGQSASAQISGIGSFSGSLNLQGDNLSHAYRTSMVEAVEPWKAMLWVMQNNYPIWAGPITGWQPSTATDGTLPFQASSVEALLQYRLLRDQAVQYSVVAGAGTSPRTTVEIASPQISSFLPVTPDSSPDSTSTTSYLVYNVLAGVDVFDLVRAIGHYAIGKAITDSNNITLPIPTGAVHIASFQVGANLAGVTVANTGDVKIDPNQGQSCYDLINSLATTYGFEWSIRPGLTQSGALSLTLLLGYPNLGRTYTATGFQFNYPSKTVIDYAWTRQAQNPANALYVTGADSNNTLTVISKYPFGFNLPELTNDYPLLEQVATLPTPTSSTPSAAQSQANSYAAGQVASQSILSQVTPSVVLGADVWPYLSDMMLGDGVVFTATSQLHPADPNTGEPGVQVMSRIISWNLTFPSPGSAETNQVVIGDISQVFS